MIYTNNIYYIKRKKDNYYCLSNIYKLSKSIPVPSATQVSGDSAINTGTLSSCANI